MIRSNNRPAHLLSLSSMAAALALSGCGAADSIELAGTWQDNYGGPPTIIDAMKWGSETLVDWDNTANFAVTQAAPDADYNPGKFSRAVWTEPKDGVFYACSVAFGLATAQEAADWVATVDATAPRPAAVAASRGPSTRRSHSDVRAADGGGCLGAVVRGLWSALAVDVDVYRRGC